MGQEIYKQRLILNAALQGDHVVATLDHCDDFALALLEMHLQMDYPNAKIVFEYDDKKYIQYLEKTVKIYFQTQEDAIHFILSH